MGHHAPKSTVSPESTVGAKPAVGLKPTVSRVRVHLPSSLGLPRLRLPRLDIARLNTAGLNAAWLYIARLSTARLSTARLNTARLNTARLSPAAAALRATVAGAAASGALPVARKAAGRAVTAARNASVVTRATAAAGLLVAVVTVAAYLTDTGGSGAIGMAGAINSLTTTDSVRQLVQEHQFILQLDRASQVLTRAAQPVAADPETLLTQSAATNATTGGTGIAAAGAPADPTAAEALGRQLLAAAGFGTSADWACLYSLWNRESGWNVYAENPSGAYGIPQAYPGRKMAEFGADWQTNPATQISWGLSYVDALYGSPCNAWDHEVAYGYY